MFIKKYDLEGIYNSQRNWQEGNIDFFQNHLYFTESASKLRQNGKENITTQE